MGLGQAKRNLRNARMYLQRYDLLSQPELLASAAAELAVCSGPLALCSDEDVYEELAATSLGVFWRQGDSVAAFGFARQALNDSRLRHSIEVAFTTASAPEQLAARRGVLRLEALVDYLPHRFDALAALAALEIFSGRLSTNGWLAVLARQPGPDGEMLGGNCAVGHAIESMLSLFGASRADIFCSSYRIFTGQSEYERLLTDLSGLGVPVEPEFLDEND